MHSANKLRKSKRTSKSRTKLKITTEGYIFIFLTIGVGLAAINTGNNMLFLVLGFMLSLIVLSGIISEVTLHGLEIRRTLPVLPWAGETSAVEISVINNKKIPSFCVEIQDVASNFTIDRRCFFLKIAAKKVQSTAYHCVFPRRGTYKFTGMVVITKFPFGFFSKSFRVVNEETLIVAPHRIYVNRNIVEPAIRGELQSSEKPDPRDNEVFSIRPYFSGDDYRRVNWKLSAHYDKLVVTEGVNRNEKYINIVFNDVLPEMTKKFSIDSLRPTLPTHIKNTEESDLQNKLFEYYVDLAASTVEVLSLAGFKIWFTTRRKTILPIVSPQMNIIITELATIQPIEDASKAPPFPEIPSGPVLFFNKPDVSIANDFHGQIEWRPENAS